MRNGYMKNAGQLFFLLTIIIVGIIYGGSVGWTISSQKNTGPLSETIHTDIINLMDSMNILRLSETQAAPEFDLLSLAEERIDLRQLRGKVVMLSFWATW